MKIRLSFSASELSDIRKENWNLESVYQLEEYTLLTDRLRRSITSECVDILGRILGDTSSYGLTVQDIRWLLGGSMTRSISELGNNSRQADLILRCLDQHPYYLEQLHLMQNPPLPAEFFDYVKMFFKSHLVLSRLLLGFSITHKIEKTSFHVSHGQHALKMLLQLYFLELRQFGPTALLFILCRARAGWHNTKISDWLDRYLVRNSETFAKYDIDNWFEQNYWSIYGKEAEEKMLHKKISNLDETTLSKAPKGLFI